ncbi:YfcE family phosphodiesterase [Bacillus sp. FJAT-27225]|uniref:metallophosphoesterase family protein n=1 Tax=Bacillus sp. FJAT-27225 TaxID=1743144 RepID=UPI00080C303D|nr:metallophosphoesterase [Bacillus sp. FJAT-27225]OCA90806.1 YfcE family phosphodiesterase [Bacillus sp. FJAT-27225]
MKIVVISDTHIPKRSKQLPDELLEEASSADLIIHAGDWQTAQVLEELSTFAKVEGVVGNVDGPELTALLPFKKVIEANGYRIGIVHGHGKGKTTEKRAIDAFCEEEVDCIVFGHSHIPVLRYEQDILLFNPGSPTDKRRQKYFSFGIIHAGESLVARHIFFSAKA